MFDRQRSPLRKLITGCTTIAMVAAGAFIAASGCSSSDAAPAAEGGACPAGGGPIMTMATDRCMGTFQDVGACTKEPTDGGAVDQDGGVDMLPEPSPGTSNNDDDCKYRVSFTNDCVQNMGAGTTFRVTLTSLTKNMAPVPDAEPYIEAFLTETHPAGGNSKTRVVAPGVYDIGPIVFDAPGQWTVRFHFFADCSDLFEDSPHAHAAFFINVP
jgi:hypothetical protein